MAVTLSMGPNLRYFFNDGKGKYLYRVPDTFIKQLLSGPIPTFHTVVFGEGDTYFASYTLPNGQSRLYFEHEDRYPKLKSWLCDEGLTHNKDLSVSLGANGAFFACSSQGQRWHNVPESLLDYYQKFTSPSKFLVSHITAVDLGYNETFLGVRKDNMWFWDLGNEYPRLKELGHLNSVISACLNPFAPDQHFVYFNNGTVHFSLPKELAGDVAQVLRSYANQTVQSPQYGFPSPTSPWSRIQSPNLGQFYQAPHMGQYTYQSPNTGQHTPQSPNIGQYAHQAHNILDQYNNITNNMGGSQNGSGTPNVYDAMQQMQSSVDAINNASNYAGQGLNLVNNVTNNGLMVAQLAGSMAACNVM